VKPKLIGIIGGIGPESTIDYYRLFVSIYRGHRPDAYPPVLINSIDLARVLKLVGANDLSGLAAYMLEEIHRLARAGATHALLSSNTPHIVSTMLISGIGEAASSASVCSERGSRCRAVSTRRCSHARA